MSTKILVLFALCVLFSLVFAQEEGLLAAPVEAAESTETTTLAEDEEVLSEFDEVETLALPASGQVRIIFDETNKYRVSKGLAKLVWDDILATRAAAHSKNMVLCNTPIANSCSIGRFHHLVPQRLPTTKIARLHL